MNISLDIRTMAFMIGLVHLMQIGVFYHQYRVNRPYPGLIWWLLWSVAETVGFGIMLFRDVPGLYSFVVFIQNSFIGTGLLFLYFGIRHFFGKGLNIKVVVPIYLLYILSLSFFLFVENDFHYRSASLNLGIAIFSFLSGWTLIKDRDARLKVTANFNAVIFFLHGIFFLYRTGVWLTKTPGVNFFEASVFNVTPFIDAMVVSIAWTFGFVIMLNNRLHVDLKEMIQQKDQIFTTSPDASVITRVSDGLIVDFNEGYLSITGYSRQEITGNTTLKINIWKDLNDRQEVIRMIKETGYCENYEAVFVRKDGTEIIGLMSARIIYLSGVPHIISISKDITARKQVEAELKHKSALLQEAVAEKDKFFGLLAHDLRSPFNAILGFTQYLEEELPSLTEKEIADIVTILRKSTLNLYRLLENLLEWSRIQRGSVIFNPHPCQLGKIINETLLVAKENAHQKHIEISADLPDTFVAVADEKMVSTVIRNLVFNAIKFTPTAGIIRVTGRRNDQNTIEITVEDNGIGMPAQIRQGLFNLNSITGRMGTAGETSTGLGLIICRDFIEKHGGILFVESEEGKGTKVTFTLPQRS
jgi:PAS domain S-box-containing protein